MKRASLVLTLALVGLVVAAPATLAAPPTSPFAGTWYSHDPAPDNSLKQLDISGGAKPQITYTDYFGSVCVNSGSPVTVFTAFATGIVSGNTLDATFVSARCGPVRIGGVKGETVSYEYSDNGTGAPGDDTLWDGTDTWARVS
jgi:hypothetical protein